MSLKTASLSLLPLPPLALLFSACIPIKPIQVLDRTTRQPIPGAMVRAETTQLTKPAEVQIQETDAQGMAKFQGSGIATLYTVGKPGYLPSRETGQLGPALLERGTVYPAPLPGKTERYERAEAERIFNDEPISYRGSVHDDRTPPELWDRWARYLKSCRPAPAKAAQAGAHS